MVLIGSGNLAYSLHDALMDSEGLELLQIAARHPGSLDDFRNGPLKSGLDRELLPADLYILAISDRAIAEVSRKLQFGNGLVLHTSGGQPLSVLSALPRSGVFYPLQTFSRERPISLQGVRVLMEHALPGDLELIRELVVRLGAIPVAADSKQRLNLHVAAVFANNFTNHLVHLADLLCVRSELNPEILKPLLRETFRKLESATAFEAQTGPARRADSSTLVQHRSLLKNTPYLTLYDQLTKSIQDTYED